MTQKLRAAGYIRVSTAGQADDGLSLDEQRESAAARIKAEGWELVEVYADEGLSGKSEDRPELQRLLADLPRLDRIVVTELSRLGRRAAGMLELFERLDEHDVALVSIRQSIDTSTAAGRLLRNVLVSVAEFESEQLGERVRAVARSKVAKGAHHGRPPYGYMKSKGALVPEPTQAEIVRRIYREAVAGKKQRGIARGLNDDGVKPLRADYWKQTVIARILSNPVYKGVVVINDEEFPGDHQALVTARQWARVEALRAKGTRSRKGGPGRNPAGPHLFTRGLLRCGLCGGAMNPRTYRKEGREEYRCQTRAERGTDACAQLSIQRETIDVAAFAYFEVVALDADALREEIAAAVDERRQLVADQLRESIAEERTAAERLERVRRAFQDGKLDPVDWTEQRTLLTAELDGARAALKQAETREADLVAAEQDAANPEGETQRRLAAIREAVAGKVASSADDLEALRTALADMFEVFYVYPIEDALVDAADRLPGELELADAVYRIMASKTAPADVFTTSDYRVVPVPQAKILEGLGEGFRPVLKRRGLRNTKDGDGLTT